MLTPELSPVSDFRDARCRDYEAKGCALGGVCNFVHFRGFPRWLTEAVGAYSERGYAVPARGESGGAGGRDRGGERGDYGRSGPARGGGGGGGGGGYDDRRGGRDRSDRDGGRDRARGYDRGDRERGDRERGGDRYRGRSRSPPRGDGGRDRRDRDGGRGREAYHDDRSSGGGSSGGGDRDRYRGTDFERDRERDRERGRDDGWDRPVEP
jgi:splicing factor U2AF subunit